ncbi:hypothetical protein ABZT06_20405 [Streptomyces sp. NPDC005483]|uniref:hypothetical protein n=1 Tax=Streptomyces sp. NPDC005483 TaxID=3154882 RepID=UPI0033B171A1
MLSHSLEQGVLVIVVHDDPGIGGRAALLAEISGLVHAHKSAPVVLVLDEPAASGAAVSAVLRAHRMCSDLGVFMSVATPSFPARRLLEVNADTTGIRLAIHASAETAVSIAAAFATAA